MQATSWPIGASLWASRSIDSGSIWRRALGARFELVGRHAGERAVDSVGREGVTSNRAGAGSGSPVGWGIWFLLKVRRGDTVLPGDVGTLSAVRGALSEWPCRCGGG